jgi:transcriptional regulator GlxA family with amidase domain
MISDEEAKFIKQSYDDCAAFLTICGGCLAPLQADIFRGKTATAPRIFLKHFHKTNPEVNWVEKRWAHDGKLRTSGALSNGTDMMAAFLTHYWGGEEDSLAEFVLRLGACPRRAVDYSDVTWKIQSALASS